MCGRPKRQVRASERAAATKRRLLDRSADGRNLLPRDLSWDHDHDRLCLSNLSRHRTTASRETGRQGIRCHRLRQLDTQSHAQTQNATPRARPSLPKKISVYYHMGTWSNYCSRYATETESISRLQITLESLRRPTVPGFIYFALVPHRNVTVRGARTSYARWRRENRRGQNFRTHVRFSLSTVSLGLGIMSNDNNSMRGKLGKNKNERRDPGGSVRCVAYCCVERIETRQRSIVTAVGLSRSCHFLTHALIRPWRLRAMELSTCN